MSILTGEEVHHAPAAARKMLSDLLGVPATPGDLWEALGELPDALDVINELAGSTELGSELYRAFAVREGIFEAALHLLRDLRDVAPHKVPAMVSRYQGLYQEERQRHLRTREHLRALAHAPEQETIDLRAAKRKIAFLEERVLALGEEMAEVQRDCDASARNTLACMQAMTESFGQDVEQGLSEEYEETCVCERCGFPNKVYKNTYQRWEEHR